MALPDLAVTRRTRRLGRAAVLGAGVMGSGIAAHLANVGVPTLLLDVAPATLADDERRRGLSLDHPLVRNRLARQGLERAGRAQPAAFFTPERAALITVGNFEDDLAKITDADWIVEAVVEDLEVKQGLLARVERHRRPDAIVSTNTSGLPVAAIAREAGAEFRRHFVGTHFFNPPRYMRLLEVIPTAQTAPEVVAAAAAWGERLLGKGVVYAKDTPNFIANRIGTFGFLTAVRLMLDLDLDVDEVDELTGPLLGRPRSATFRTADLSGLDVLLHVAANGYRNLPEDEARDLYQAPPLLAEMAARGWLGEKAGGGFYRRQDGEILALDHRTLEYRPRRRLSTPALEAARAIDEPGRRLAALVTMPDRYGEFLRRLTDATLAYAARRIPEISDDIVNVDRAMRWGFGWEAGPFETWDALVAAGGASALPEAAGAAAPELVRLVREHGVGTFYRDEPAGRAYFDLAARAYRPEPGLGERIVLAALRRANRTVERNAGASLVDLGDGVLCLEFHSKLNTIGEDMVVMGERALERLRVDFDALVVGNQGRDFCAGANLMLVLLEAQEGNWEDLDAAIRRFQALMMAFRRSSAPVVAAPAGRTLGGGVEFCLAAAHVQAAAETYMGMVEPGVGLIPAGTGTMEMAKRTAARFPDEVPGDLLPLLRWTFETIAMAKVSTSAEDARRLGLLRPCDGISTSTDLHLTDAKAAALALVRAQYRPAPPATIRVAGERGLAAIDTFLHIMRTGGHITDHDVTVSRRLAYVLCGGAVPEGTRVAEEYLLELEREAFLSLLGTPQTQDRIRHMLQTGKPLRN
ncbi:MAG: 3-hydroxyacyl-CoA dehydrogenase/enoyl-CoA hydratase family protein [Armatimonadota bacterium]|nr:3-hydroxyacyl-CoA dehydrogenase/enoyl-CoA hydratase family protein [Armatimonadota bacterium]MDR7455799.1 3-hydroxyacyl-CoA dehydrogenase/enoyl-CoA hydratase family protein [Armatimonadota bacterium]MDR7496417.1 3-hydroxyacyl-CoA dehydrogenase/enoyl-CoA hydratase family protein [Armatimonadota bacterium]MDR7511460.1 3-hydroxyacyl-CoA dehydrogenase/enoyl-CoA hydratase family protein [Armatimonadota bacterium]